MADKCILIKETEWTEIKSNSDKYEYTKKQLEKVESELRELKEQYNSEHPELTVRFETALFGKYNEYGGYYSSKREFINSKIIDYVSCSIHSTSVSIQGKFRNILQNISDKLEKELKRWITDYLDSSMKSEYESRIDKESEKYNKLLTAVKQHDSKCWFSKNKILK